MGKIFKTFLAKFFKVFGLTFVTAFCVIQLSYVTGEGASLALLVLWIMGLIGGASTIFVLGLFNEKFYVAPTAIVIIVGITPFIKSYLAALGIATLWLGYELFEEEWFSDFGWQIKAYIKESKKLLLRSTVKKTQKYMTM